MKKKYRARRTLGITLVGRWTLRAEVLHRRGCGLWVCRLSNRRDHKTVVHVGFFSGARR